MRTSFKIDLCNSMKFFPVLIMTFIFSLYTLTEAQPKKKPVRVNPMTPIVGVNGLPHALIIGDSISIGYTLPTRALLKGKSEKYVRRGARLSKTALKQSKTTERSVSSAMSPQVMVR